MVPVHVGKHQKIKFLLKSGDAGEILVAYIADGH